MSDIENKVKAIQYVLTLICAISLYVSFMCYIQIVDYQQQIIGQNKRIDEATARWSRLNEEDILLLQKIDEQNKRIKEQDDKIRIQDALIAEARTRTKRK
jgi:hypothetical protein